MFVNRNETMMKCFSVLSLLIPMIYILYVLIMKPTYITVSSKWNADKYWMFFSIRYWARTLLIISALSSCFSILSFQNMCRNRVKKMPWIVFQLFSPFCVIISVFVCVLIHYSGILKI